MNQPCYGCGDREVGCHADCERYAEYRKDIVAKKKARSAHPVQIAYQYKVRKLERDGKLKQNPWKRV